MRVAILRMLDPVVIVALSGRALAQSARRGGMRPVVLDVFADSDTQALSDITVRLQHDSQGIDNFSLQQSLQDLPGSVAQGGLVFGGGLEQLTSVIEAWSERYPVYGNSQEVVRCVNNSQQFFSLLKTLDIPFPETSFTPPSRNISVWLVKKQLTSGGGHVQCYDPFRHYGSDVYFQQFVKGTPVSLLFLADGNKIQIVGFNTQWVTGQKDKPFQYKGAINRTTLSADQKMKMFSYAEKLTEVLSLKGLNSLDCVATADSLKVLELNPRPSATLELYDPDVLDGLLGQHIAACQGKLPTKDNWISSSVRAHHIIYATSATNIPDDFYWPVWTSDCPAGSHRIDTGSPICTVVADGEDIATVTGRLHMRRQALCSQIQRHRVAA